MAKCGKPCTVWSRIVGFYRSTNHWNKGKQQEFEDRREFTAPPVEAMPKVHRPKKEEGGEK